MSCSEHGTKVKRSHLVKVHFLPVAVVDKEVEVLLHDRPRLLRGRSVLVEEGQDVDVDAVDSIEHDLGVVGILLESVRHLADGDRYVETREARLS